MHVVSEYVVDASAMVAALTRKDVAASGLRRLLASCPTHAPYLLDAEVGQALRGLERRGEITEEEACTGLRALPRLIDHRYDHGPLLEHAWATRHNITFYDGLYTTLAAALDFPLLSGDLRLSRAAGLPCEIELVR